MTERKINRTLLLPVLGMLLAGGCTKEQFITLEEQVEREYRIAIVLPLAGGMENRWKKSVEWALDNVNATLIAQRHIRVHAEWYDEEAYGMKELFAGLAARNDLSAVIGPLYSKDAEIAAGECVRTGKPLLAMASSELLMRAFANKDFLWCLTENDISQCELLLTLAARKNAKSVALLTCDNIYGQTFLDWFAFQARELNLEVKETVVYNELNLQSQMQAMLNKNTDCIVCVPSDNRVASQMNAIRSASPEPSPLLLFSDVAFLVEPDLSFEGMEGIVQAPDPESGFHTAYEIKYGVAPEYGSAQFYDAVLLAALGILEAGLAGEAQINSALKRIVDGDGEPLNVCSGEAIERLVSLLINRQYPRISGASGKLRFDNTIYTNVLHSVYSYQMVYEGKYLVLGYIVSDESRRTSASSINWNWKISQVQNFEDTVRIRYPARKDLYVVIIAGSSGWKNYRHQADAWAMYRMLKRKHMPDDRILLIMENDIAFHPDNPDPGEVRIIPEGENLYRQGAVDYNLTGLPFDELPEIFSGKGDILLPDSLDNVLVFWVGHGEPNGLKWLDETISPRQIAGLFEELSTEKHFRKLLFIIEACYAGKTGEYCEGIPGLLCITAAAADETSKVSRYSHRLETWLSNSFTDALLECLENTPSISLADLYRKTYSRTIGSHVSVYNAPSFGNLYQTSLNEFLIP